MEKAAGTMALQRAIFCRIGSHLRKPTSHPRTRHDAIKANTVTSDKASRAMGLARFL
jgi:hypothetical protein